jgi:hypothetical protein
VLKEGPGVAEEGEYCRALGPEVCPRVLWVTPMGYVMERLQPAPRSPGLLRVVERALREHVWSRPERPLHMETWRLNLWNELAVRAPDWVVPDHYCNVHGDPTAANALVRLPENSVAELVLCDPLVPRSYMAPCAEADCGKILQSALGWEIVLCGDEPTEWEEPDFWGDDVRRRRALFWCAVAGLRILRQEMTREKPRGPVLDWCRWMRARCQEQGDFR